MIEAFVFERRRERSSAAPPPTPDAAGATAGPTLVEIRGPYQAFSDLPVVKGIMIEDHGQHQLADGTWSVNAYLSSADLVEVIRGRGLQVKVLKTAAELARQGEEMAHELEAAEHRDGGPRAAPRR